MLDSKAFTPTPFYISSCQNNFNCFVIYKAITVNTDCKHYTKMYTVCKPASYGMLQRASDLGGFFGMILLAYLFTSWCRICHITLYTGSQPTL